MKKNNYLISKDFKKIFEFQDIKNLVENINNFTPVKLHEKTSVYKTSFKDFNIYIKEFFYPNIFIKTFKKKGLKSYLNSLKLKNLKINIPKPIFYYSYKNMEYFGTLEVENSMELYFFLKQNSNEIRKKVLKNLENFIKKLFRNSIYHSDFNKSNILVQHNNLELYLLDLHDVKFNLNNKRKLKMIRKLNRRGLKEFNLKLDPKKFL